MSFDEKSAAEIEYAVHGKVTVITINRPREYGALNFSHYQRLEELMYQAEQEPHTVATLIQGTGKYFSAGADVSSGNDSPTKRTIDTDGVDLETRRALLGPFAGRNSLLSETFWTHPKLLVVALNGPVIGLSAAFVACADLIVARESAFLLVPFANLSLVSEGASGFTLPMRLGLSLANQALLASQPISAKDLLRVGFLNWTVPESVPVEEFNKQTLGWVTDKVDKLDADSITRIKTLVHMPYDREFGQMVHKEVLGGLDRFARGLPQARFKALSQKQHRHKL